MSVFLMKCEHFNHHLSSYLQTTPPNKWISLHCH